SVVDAVVVFSLFQAEDGIRDFHVTGVQTCALPIWSTRSRTPASPRLMTAALPRKIPRFGTTSAAPKPCERSPRRRLASSCRLATVLNQARTWGFQWVGPTRSEERRVGTGVRVWT